MRIGKIFAVAVLLVLPLLAGAQETGVQVDYNSPKKYLVGGISVEGNSYFSDDAIVQLTGLQKGMEITVPSEDVSSVVKRLWLQRYFEDVALDIDHLSAGGDSLYLVIRIKERPRVSRWTFSGVKSGEKKDLQERLNLRRGGEFGRKPLPVAQDAETHAVLLEGLKFLDHRVEHQLHQGHDLLLGAGPVLLGECEE